MNPSRATIDDLATKTPMTTLQLHGNEPLEIIQYIREHHPDLRIIKALSAHNHEELQTRLDYYINQVDELIIDTPSQDYGGTGQTYDWEILHGIHDVPFMIAGGLNYDHIQTIKQMDLNHHGYDIASGIETEGRKDLDKMIRIIESVKGVTKHGKSI
ncbi:N-(5'-phosphoribosyl)anthranilate isomerase [Staphylococcus argensis]